MPTPTWACAIQPSTRKATYTWARATTSTPIPTCVRATHFDTDFEGARTQMRHRKRFAFAIASAAMVLFAGVGFATRGESAAQPHAELDTSEVVVMREQDVGP